MGTNLSTEDRSDVIRYSDDGVNSLLLAVLSKCSMGVPSAALSIFMWRLCDFQGPPFPFVDPGVSPVSDGLGFDLCQGDHGDRQDRKKAVKDKAKK